MVIIYAKTSYTVPIWRLDDGFAGVASLALARVGRPVTFLLIFDDAIRILKVYLLFKPKDIPL